MEPVATKEQPSNIQRLKDNLPVISVALLILGTVNLMLYYGHFNIDILSYLDFTEILQIQFRLFASTAAAIVFMILYLALTQKVAELFIFGGKKGEAQIQIRTEDVKPPSKYAKWAINIFTYGSITASLISTANTTSNTTASSGGQYDIVWVLSIFVVIAAVLYTYFQVRRVAKEDAAKNPDVDAATVRRQLDMLKWVGFFIICIYISGVLARFEAEFILSDSSNYEATIVMEKQTITTNKNYRYLGRTKNFTFFYSISKKQAEVYPNSDIKNTFMRDGVNYNPDAGKPKRSVMNGVYNVIDWFRGLRN